MFQIKNKSVNNKPEISNINVLSLVGWSAEREWVRGYKNGGQGLSSMFYLHWKQRDEVGWASFRDCAEFSRNIKPGEQKSIRACSSEHLLQKTVRITVKPALPLTSLLLFCVNSPEQFAAGEAPTSPAFYVCSADSKNNRSAAVNGWGDSFTENRVKICFARLFWRCLIKEVTSAVFFLPVRDVSIFLCREVQIKNVLPAHLIKHWRVISSLWRLQWRTVLTRRPAAL